MAGRWPENLWIIRHGESAGNVAAREAVEDGGHHFRFAMRDADVPLSATGEAQAIALGKWFACQDAGDRPDIVLASPYSRARRTAEIFQQAGGMAANAPILVDERLREKECGILDGLTPEGVASLHPEQANHRALLGKFYHRPPGGENWCDVILRLRGVADRLSLHHAGDRVMIVAHEVIVFCLRYIFENLDEHGIMAIDAQGDIANCAITEYQFDPRRSGLSLTRFNEPTAFVGSQTLVTDARDQIVAARG
jgi:broad specificity phosphatase PhoE